MTLRERLLSKRVVDPETDCWVWTAATNGSYGQIRVAGKAEGAHRVSYELLVGPIPDGLQIDHLCRNRLCINPAHLEPVTSRENTLRGNGACANNARKVRCRLGHPLVGDNIYRHPQRGGRECRTCRNARNDISNAKRRKK